MPIQVTKKITFLSLQSMTAFHSSHLSLAPSLEPRSEESPEWSHQTAQEAEDEGMDGKGHPVVGKQTKDLKWI